MIRGLNEKTSLSKSPQQKASYLMKTSLKLNGNLINGGVFWKTSHHGALLGYPPVQL
jgi:hypothetical protein